MKKNGIQKQLNMIDNTKNTNEIYLCAINNIESGTCPEDCTFCTQSIKYKAKIDRYKKKPISQIVEEAYIAKANKAIGYCLVTAGAGLDDERTEYISKAAYAIKKANIDLNIIACNGIASLDQLKELKKAGVDNYNHNLESSKEYYPNLCSTHSWNDRFQTCLNIKEAGLALCTGGIFGLGESVEDRISMFNSIKELKPMSTPINFFHPNTALPIKSNTLSKQDAFNIIANARKILGDEIMIMVAGGREFIFKDDQYDIFKYGANSIVIGDYLTTSGDNVSKELKLLEEQGFKIATSCNR
jgi:biotin synthase